VGDDAMQMVVDARQAGGAFKSLDDFADRVDLRRLNRKTLECLVQAGALDDFGGRAALMTLIDTLLGMSAQAHSARDVGQFSLFDNMSDLRQSIALPSYAPPIPDRQILEWEKELLGTYLSKHPLADQERDLLKRELLTTTIGEHSTEAPGQMMKLVGMVQRVRRITTKKGAMMAFVSLEAPGGTAECVVFPKTYESFKDLLTPNRVLVVCGKLDNQPDREEHSLVAEWFKEPHEFLLAAPANPTDPLVGAEGGMVEQETPRYLAPMPPSRNGRNGDNGGGQIERKGPSSSLDASEPTWPASVVGMAEGSGPSEVTAPMPPPDPPAPPATLYITLRRSGDNGSDFQKLARLHKVLRRERGTDRFVVVLDGEQKVELAFPNETTRCTYDLRQQITAIVGAENLRVIQQ
jgi:DNA polymerase-3 subunit alpha